MVAVTLNREPTRSEVTIQCQSADGRLIGAGGKGQKRDAGELRGGLQIDEQRGVLADGQRISFRTGLGVAVDGELASDDQPAGEVDRVNPAAGDVELDGVPDTAALAGGGV